MHWENTSALVGQLGASCAVARMRNIQECREVIEFAQVNGLSVCPKGGGYSYGDAILNDNNLLLDVTKMNTVKGFDVNSGQIIVEPGVRLIDVQELALPNQLVLASVPSEPNITVGGAACANVNGKDGWQVGNFGDQVLQLKLMIATGEIISASRSENTDVFYAAIGGMGLLGVVVELTLQLQRIPSPFIHVSRHTAPCLTALLEKLEKVKKENTHAVIWLDAFATGHKFGRGVIHAVRWLDYREEENLEPLIRKSLSRLDSRKAFADKMAPLVGAVVSLMMNFQTISVGLFNKLYFRYCELRTRLGSADNDESIVRYSFDASFMIPSASAVCGPYGYTIQLLIPNSTAQDAITELLKICQESPCYPAKLIMRMHRQDQHVISFCGDGLSLNLEFHPKKRQAKKMKKFADELIRITIKHGGKVHLAKDHILSRTQFQSLYPRHHEFLDFKQRLDPDELFQSDLYRRLLRREDQLTSDSSAAKISA